MHKADVIVAGAGPNGLAMALAIGGNSVSRPLDVALIDAGSPVARQHAATDTRGLALTLATQGLLRALGAWNVLAPHLQEMRQIAVTDGSGALAGRPVLLSFVTDERQRAAAAVAENRHVTDALVAAVKDSPRIKVFADASLIEADAGPGQVTVTAADGRQFRAPLIIGADGRNSFVRQAAAISVQSRPYRQTALTFSVSHEQPHHGRAQEHFSSDGVFALLPLPGDMSSIVWGTTPERAQHLMALSVPDFESTLNDEAGGELGRLALAGQRQAYPLIMQLASSLTAPRIALAGDAAHVLHPLAGLGLNLGFKDVAALAECIHEAVARGEDHGGAAVLERYASWRRFDTAMTAALMEGFNALFVNGNPALKLLRDAGLRLADHLPVMKNIFIREASGLSGDLPRLMRGLAP